MVFHRQRERKSAGLLCVLLCLLSAAVALNPSCNAHSNEAHTDAPSVCVIVRTYWGHGDGLLQDLLRSFQRQKYKRWEALLVVMDSVPFSRLPLILEEIADDRIWVFAELIGSGYTPKQGGAWAPGYHGLLYNLTDQAIRACPPSTEWVLATNGDNIYADAFFDRVMSASDDADAIAFDFYSRYQRITGPPCTRFQCCGGEIACKSNRMKWCHTDLGANVYRWPRLLREGRRLGYPAAAAQEHQAEHFDGLFASTIEQEGWSVHHVTDACLYDHHPSPQRCAQKGGVWDDSRAVSTELGGTCLTQEEARVHLQNGGTAMEVTEVELSHDGNLASFLDESSNASTSIRCIRWADTESQHQASMVFYGSTCADDADLSDLAAFSSLGLSEQEQHRVLEKVQLQSMKLRPVPWQRAPMLERRPPKPPPRDQAILPKQRNRVPQPPVSVEQSTLEPKHNEF